MSIPPDDGPECPPGTHSMFDFCPGRAICNEGFYPDCPYDGMYGEHLHIMGPRGWVCAPDPGLVVGGCSCSVNSRAICPYCASVMNEMIAADADDGPGRCDCTWGEPFACRNHCPTDRTDEKERGVLSTLRRWARARLDPHARAARRLDRQLRAGLDGGEPGDQGRER